MQSERYIVFKPDLVLELVNKHKKTFEALKALETELQARYYSMNEAIRAMLLAAATGESLLLIGPPGTAKSSLVRTFCSYLGIDPADEEDHDYFEYLLTQFTEPSELFGYYDLLQAQKSGELKRKSDGMIQEARIVYLDEVFNASSAILNSLLAMMNERFYHERGEVFYAKLEVLYGATNNIPESDDLRAFFDRFLLRYRVDNVRAEHQDMADMLPMGWGTTYNSDRTLNLSERNGNGNSAPNSKANTTLLNDLREFRLDVDTYANSLLADAREAQQGSNFYASLALFVKATRYYRLAEMSNRRLVKFMNLLLVNLVYRMCSENLTSKTDASMRHEDFALLRYMLDTPSIPEFHADKLPPLKVKSW